MELYCGLIVLGLVCLSAPFWAKLAGYETHRKRFDLAGASGVFFMLAASFKLATSMSTRLAVTCGPLMMLSFILGVVGLLNWRVLDGGRGPPGNRPPNPRHQGRPIAVVRSWGADPLYARPNCSLLSKPNRRRSTWQGPARCALQEGVN
jgi:hypothetical protein